MKKYIVALISASLLLSVAVPLTASADFRADLQSQLNELLIQVAKLQAQVAQNNTQVTASTATSVSNDTCTINRNLYSGLSGNDVRCLQGYLIEEGFLKVGATGYFGSATRAAVAQWQAANGISAVGIFGQLSRAKYIKLIANASNNGSDDTSGTTNPVATPTPSPVANPSPTQALAPTLSYIRPTSVKAGETVYVYGANFGQYTYVAFDGNFGQTIWPNNAPANGTGAFSFTVPSNATAGTHTVQVTEKGASFPLSNSLTLTVQSEVQAPTLSYINPTSVKAGAIVYVYGANFGPNTYVAFDGNFGLTIWPSNAPAAGTGAFSFTVPANTSTGSHTVQVAEKGASFPASNSITLTVVSDPTMTITSQRYGWTRNNYVPITWSTNTGGSAPNGVFIDFVGSTGYIYHVAQGLANTGSYNLFLKNDISGNAIPDGYYSLKLCAQLTTGEAICDIQDPTLFSDKG